MYFGLWTNLNDILAVVVGNPDLTAQLQRSTILLANYQTYTDPNGESVGDGAVLFLDPLNGETYEMTLKHDSVTGVQGQWGARVIPGGLPAVGHHGLDLTYVPHLHSPPLTPVEPWWADREAAYNYQKSL